MKRPRPLRIGCVPYLNAQPLIAGLDRPPVIATPARLADLLRHGKLDVALLPSLEFFREPYAHVPGIAVASDGPVESVRLHLRAPPQFVINCALDRNSVTSNALALILLEEHYGVSPHTLVYDPRRQRPDTLKTIDAAVTIGDNSFRPSKLPYLDLGTEWKRLTGLPFVYALWAYPRAHPRRLLIHRLLHKSLRVGLQSRRELALREAKRRKLDPAFSVRYLTRSIRYTLGARERSGLRLFRRYCLKMELL